MAATSANLRMGAATSLLLHSTTLGYIKDGVTITPTFDIYTAGESVEQLTGPVKAHRPSETIEISFTSIEPKHNTDFGDMFDSDNVPGGVPVVSNWGDNQYTPQSGLFVMIASGPNGASWTWNFADVRISSPPEWTSTKQGEDAWTVTATAMYSESVTRAIQLTET